MARFLKGNELNSELEKIFENACVEIILISPYIKLHERYVSTLKSKMKPEIKVTVVFGKNEENYSASMSESDFNFFKEFPNIEIRYEKRLHAKYYANESNAIITSMNLYGYSQNNNIEAGVMTKRQMLSLDELDDEAFAYFSMVIEQADLLYKKVPQVENKWIGLTRRYLPSVVEIDTLSDFFAGTKKAETTNGTNRTFEKSAIRTVSQPITSATGYCIRTSKHIPFNPAQPMCADAYKSWQKFGNKSYAEKYCHFTGEPSNGETSFAKPILKKNLNRAKEIHHL
jgi:hypothetical protein